MHMRNVQLQAFEVKDNTFGTSKLLHAFKLI